jgi:sirohydrochlorin cobaltochelatase
VSRTPKPAALLLVGHGSHYSLDSSHPVHALARVARELGEFAEVRVAFWKEEPFLHHAFDLIESETVLVVPVFTSLGYFTDRVVPRELGLERSVTVKDGRRVHYLAPIGSRSEMAAIVLDRAREALALREASAVSEGSAVREDPSETTLVVLGHGTEEHAGSGGATSHLAARLATESGYASVVPAFLDQTPTLSEVLAQIRTRGTVIVPFFVSEGWHVGTTIPRDLARVGDVGGGPANDRWIAFAKPVGTHPDVLAVVVGLARDAWTRAAVGGESDAAPVPAGPASVREAREEFTGWALAGEGPRGFLETVVRVDASGRFEVRHELDADVPADALRTFTDPEAALEIVLTTEGGRIRPLRTSPDLRRGWRLTGLDAEGLWVVYAHLYPAAPIHAFLHTRGELRIVPFEVAAGRQTGMYAGVSHLQGSSLAELVRRRCGAGCLRVPVWHPSAGATEPFAERAGSRVSVPCNEPCSLLISEARTTLDPSGPPE